ncbi:cilia- and flagella-associated protein 418-like [Ptychodera flava]|uniref:cilia- and flagella-associated protein 418-like n=1 Tax=Ptychodera flava TaxID=63121 RepID=UPI00396A23D1
MEDDIDDLLDEVETKFCTNSPRKSKSKEANKTSSSNASKKTKSGFKKSFGDDDLDAMIDDICDAPEPLEKIQVQKESSHSSNSQLEKKCFPVYLGGASTPVGVGTTMSQRSCDKLRCTDCDFKIVMYDNYEWHSSCDYLFLRNNVPDFNKLSAKLLKKKGSRAYACQCKWRSVKDLVDIQKEADLKWVCGKHKL